MTACNLFIFQAFTTAAASTGRKRAKHANCPFINEGLASKNKHVDE
jgi:hypothetical protein